MPTVQQMLDIACRHVTAMADAMVAACLQWALDHGEPLRLPGGRRERPPRAGRPRGAAQADPYEGADWERMVRGNADTKSMHQ